MDAKTMTMPNGDVINLKDDVARAKIGTGTLETEAQTCIGGINELKQSLTYSSTTFTENGLTINCEKVGQVVTITINDGQTVSAVTTSDVAFHIPSGYRPAMIHQFLNMYTGKRFSVFTNGSVMPMGEGVPAGTIVRTIVTYFTN